MTEKTIEKKKIPFTTRDGRIVQFIFQHTAQHNTNRNCLMGGLLPDKLNKSDGFVNGKRAVRITPPDPKNPRDPYLLSYEVKEYRYKETKEEIMALCKANGKPFKLGG